MSDTLDMMIEWEEVTNLYFNQFGRAKALLNGYVSEVRPNFGLDINGNFQFIDKMNTNVTQADCSAESTFNISDDTSPVVDIINSCLLVPLDVPSFKRVDVIENPSLKIVGYTQIDTKHIQNFFTKTFYFSNFILTKYPVLFYFIFAPEKAIYVLDDPYQMKGRRLYPCLILETNKCLHLL